MSGLIHEFLVWSIGFAVVSSLTLLIAHLVGRRLRKSSTASDVAGKEQAPRRPAWTATLIVFGR